MKIVISSSEATKPFRHQKFRETQECSPTNIFGAVRQQILVSRSWYSPRRPKMFRQQKFYETQKCSPTKFYPSFFLKHRRLPLRNFSELWDNKFSTKNRDTRSPFIIHKIFRQQKFYETQKCSPTKFFGTVRQQILEWRSWYSPLRHKIRRHQIFCEAQKFSPTKFLGTVRQRIFEWRSWYSPLRQKVFRYSKFSKKEKVSFTNFFDTVR